jgi:hypothetical protein
MNKERREGAKDYQNIRGKQITDKNKLEANREVKQQ